MSETLERRAIDAFGARYGAEPTIVARAPGRVELLGNHTDYNGGLVLAAAIDRDTVVAGRALEGRSARLVASAFDQEIAFTVDEEGIGPAGSWGRYARGVVRALTDRYGALRSGFEAAIVGEIPLGAGLSSSASLEAALALFLMGIGALESGAGRGEALDDPTRIDLAVTLRRAENEYVGVASGLLDQFSSLFGRADHALLLDCRDATYRRLPLGDPAPLVVVCDSKTSRRLADGMYNRRREECDRVVAAFRDRRGPGSVAWLRDLTLDELTAAWDDLDPVGRRRARHVLTENERVRQGVEALGRGDAEALGRLMSASHASSRDDFENSSTALNALFGAAEEAPGFLGGKLSGAGWAGCTVNLVAADRADAFAEAVAEGYARRTGHTPEVYVCRAADGASARSMGPTSPGP